MEAIKPFFKFAYIPLCVDATLDQSHDLGPLHSFCETYRGGLYIVIMQGV